MLTHLPAQSRRARVTLCFLSKITQTGFTCQKTLSLKVRGGGQVEEVISHTAGGRSLRGLIIFMGDVMYF